MKKIPSLILVILVGCSQNPAAQPKPTKPVDNFTSDAELIAWKDGPAEKFKGKTFRIKAKLYQNEPIRSSTGRVLFTKSARVKDVHADIEFNLDVTGVSDLPNLSFLDTATVEFESTKGELKTGNRAISISR